jgi:hypothetical protein
MRTDLDHVGLDAASVRDRVTGEHNWYGEDP